MYTEKHSPAPPEILEERDMAIIRFGNTEVIQAKDSLTIQVQCKNRPDSEPIASPSR